jgi:hypothetical protein
MGLLSFINKKSESRKPLHLIIDIDSGNNNCRGALSIMDNGIPKVLYSVSSAPKIPPFPEQEINHELVSSALSNILSNIADAIRSANSAKENFAVDGVYCLLSSPYYLSHTTVINYNGNEEFLVTKDLVSDLIQKSITNPISERIHGNSESMMEPVILSQKIVNISVNGYDTVNPYGLKGRELKISVFNTRVPKILFNTIKNTISKYSTANISIEPFSIASYVVLKNELSDESDFILVNIESEVTEVSLVKHHTILESVSFPFGNNNLIRHLSKKLNLPFNEVDSQLSLLNDGSLLASVATKMLEGIEESKAEWFSYFENSMVMLSEEAHLPYTVHIISDKKMQKYFGNFAMNKGFASQALVPDGFKINIIDQEKLLEKCKFNESAIFDPSIALGTLFSYAQTDKLEETNKSTSNKN